MKRKLRVLNLETLNITGLFLAFLFLYTVTACSLEDGIDTVEKSSYATLQEELDEYTLHFFKTCSVNSRKGLGLSKFFKAVKADFVGCANGSVVCSIGASRKKWYDLHTKNIEDQIMDEESVQMISLLKEQLDSLVSVYRSDNTNFGALHNASILQSLFNDDFEFDTTEQLVYSISASIDALKIPFQEIDAYVAVSEINGFYERVYDDDISVMYSRLCELYPEKADEFEIQVRYLSAIGNLDTYGDIYKFTEGYISIIKNSDIPIVGKRELQSNLTIAPASFQLWQTIDSLY